MGEKRDYRICKIDRAGQVLGTPAIYSAESDEAALSFAMRLRSGDEGVSVWQAGRLVLECGPDPQDQVQDKPCREVRSYTCQGETTKRPD